LSIFDLLELGIAVEMLTPSRVFAVGLQAIAQFVQQIH